MFCCIPTTYNMFSTYHWKIRKQNHLDYALLFGGLICLIQGSNLALANLLNASTFLKKASRNCHHLLRLASENKSFSYQPNYTTQHKLYGKQCRSWSASFWRSLLIWIHTVCKETWILVQKDLNDIVNQSLWCMFTWMLIEFVQFSNLWSNW